MGNIGRRGFLGLMATAMVAAGIDVEAVDVEKLLWAPGEKKLFLPPVGGWKRSDYAAAFKQQAALNRLNSQILEQANVKPLTLANMAKIALESFEDAMAQLPGNQIVGMIGDPRDGNGWRPGDMMQVRLNADFNRLHARLDAEPFVYQVKTAPVETASASIEVTRRPDAQRWDVHASAARDAGRMLAHHANRAGMTMFVQPRLPSTAEAGLASSLKSAVRVIKRYDMEKGTDFYYFDVLGAKV